MPRMTYHVYIMASGPRGTLYVGITNDLGRRIVEHREGRGSKFVWEYKVFAWSMPRRSTIHVTRLRPRSESRSGTALGRLL